MILWKGLIALALVSVLLMPSAATAHYTPKSGDYFNYYETITVNGGQGNYTGYTEQQNVNGTEHITSLLPGNVASSFYQYFWTFSNNTGSSSSGSSAGNFTFSYETYRYVNGTDSQTGYSNPYVWFYMNNSLGQGSQFYLLNTQMKVVSTGYSYKLPSTGSYVKTIFSEGNGSYPRNDVYGSFTATYNWKAYFDTSTGYIVGYVYTEHDANSFGDGFTYTEILYVTHTTYSLTPGQAPTQPPSLNLNDILVIAALVIVVMLVITALVLRSLSRRRRAKLPQHPGGGKVEYGYAPMPPQQGAPPQQPPGPPPISFTPEQPPVQQIVVKEVVKVKCQFCGTLIDSTALRCPVCGAPRS